MFKYIETIYNTVRINGSCNYMSPSMFEKKHRLNKDLRNNYRLGSMTESKGTINFSSPILDILPLFYLI